jgi:hypothetical protein
MTKLLLAVTLVVLLLAFGAGPAMAQQRSGSATVQEQVRELDSGRAVEVRFLNGERLRGWISEVSNSGFTLSHEVKKHLEKTPVSFDQVKWVKQVNSVKPSHTARNIVIGVVIAVVAIGVAFGIAWSQTGFG